MSLADYLQAVGLPQYVSEEDSPPQIAVEALFKQSMGIATTLSDKELSDLFTYKVPEVGADEEVRIGEIAKEPFKLTEVFKIPYDLEALRTTHSDTTEWLWRLNQLVVALQKQVGVQWLGIYRVVTFEENDALVKLAYFGEYGRAVFPLTPEFIEISNTSWVGSTGTAKLIADRASYKGAYYAFSNNERSEVCLPIIGADGEIVGVLNAESWEVGECALPRVVLPLARACLELGNTSFATVPIDPQ